MAGVLRRLVTEVVLKSAKAVKDLKAYDLLWKAVAKSVDASASTIERSADRAAAAMSRISAGAASVRASAGAGAGGGGRGGGGSRRPGKDPLDDAVGRANKVAARQAGLAAGAQTINEATSALGRFATASDKAKAKVADLSAQVERNRREMADLKVQALKTGDADGTLTERMKGLAASTRQAEVALQGARKDLRALDSGLIDTIRNAAKFNISAQAIAVTLGNLGTRVVTGGLSLIRDGLTAAAKSAIDFESGMADVKKVLPSTMDAKQVAGLGEGIKSISKQVGVMPEQVAALTASLAQSGIVGDELLATAEDASKLAVAFGVSGEDAGQALAKLRTGLGLSRDGVNSLTGSINELSNNLAATAPEITDAVQRVGSVAKSANISAESTAALATAMIASGANAEVAATGTKNFIRALGAGAAATKKQREGLAALGLEAEDVATNLTKGGKVAEATIIDVVKRIGKLRDDDRLPAIIEIFGSESIGAIGPLATNVELLGKAFEIAGDKTEAAGSVQKEYETRSKTTAAAIDRLKANIGVLAIELGNALLPYIQKISDFLTSPEGQKWGADAVETAKNAVVGLAEAVKSVASFLGFLSDKIGGAGLAVTGFGVAVAGLAGPFGVALAAGLAMGAGIAEAIDRVVNRAERAQRAMDDLHRKAEAIRRQERVAELDEAHKEGEQANLEIRQRKQAFDAAERWYQRESKKAGADKGKLLKRRNAMEAELLTGRFSAGTTFEERLAAFDADDGGDVVGLAEARANIKASKAAKHKGRGHKATKMDRQLAALSPELAGVLTRGGATDKGGDMMVHDDILSRGAFRAAGATHGLGGIGGGAGGVGPGPNITTTNIINDIKIIQQIDARSTGSVPENIRTAAYDAGTQAGNIIWTGIERAKTLKQGGGRMA